jgi:hypothetical protein
MTAVVGNGTIGAALSGLDPQETYWTTPDPAGDPDRRILMVRRGNAPFADRAWSTHDWNGRFLHSGHYDMDADAAAADLDARTRRASGQ